MNVTVNPAVLTGSSVETPIKSYGLSALVTNGGSYTNPQFKAITMPSASMRLRKVCAMGITAKATLSDCFTEHLQLNGFLVGYSDVDVYPLGYNIDIPALFGGTPSIFVSSDNRIVLSRFPARVANSTFMHQIYFDFSTGVRDYDQFNLSSPGGGALGDLIPILDLATFANNTNPDPRYPFYVYDFWINPSGIVYLVRHSNLNGSSAALLRLQIPPLPNATFVDSFIIPSVGKLVVGLLLKGGNHYKCLIEPDFTQMLCANYTSYNFTYGQFLVNVDLSMYCVELQCDECQPIYFHNISCGYFLNQLFYTNVYYNFNPGNFSAPKSPYLWFLPGSPYLSITYEPPSIPLTSQSPQHIFIANASGIFADIRQAEGTPVLIPRGDARKVYSKDGFANYVQSGNISGMDGISIDFLNTGRLTQNYTFASSSFNSTTPLYTFGDIHPVASIDRCAVRVHLHNEWVRVHVGVKSKV
jgi:hypothetical protein